MRNKKNKKIKNKKSYAYFIDFLKIKEYEN